MLLVLLIVLLFVGLGGGVVFHPLWILAGLVIVALIYDRRGSRVP